jgi:hypothetical protein
VLLCPLNRGKINGAHAASANSANAISYFTQDDLFSFAPTMKKKLIVTDIKVLSKREASNLLQVRTVTRRAFFQKKAACV